MPPPTTYTASSGKTIDAGDVDLLVRALSMGKLHHAMMGTAAVAIGTAAAIPGTLVNLAPAAASAKLCALATRPAPLRVAPRPSRWTASGR